MAEVIDLERRKKLKQDLSRADKLEGLKSVLRCSQCSAKCAKCGAHNMPTSHVTHPGTRVSFRLCPDCLDEYGDLTAYLDSGAKYSGPYWHNREWVRQWLAWIDYQWAMENYLSSPEVLSIIAELDKE